MKTDEQTAGRSGLALFCAVLAVTLVVSCGVYVWLDVESQKKSDALERARYDEAQAKMRAKEESQRRAEEMAAEEARQVPIRAKEDARKWDEIHLGKPELSPGQVRERTRALQAVTRRMKTKKLEALVPLGKQTDLKAVLDALGKGDPNGLIGDKKIVWGIRPHSFEGISPREGFEILKLEHSSSSNKRVWLPPDMAGVGPHFLVRRNDRYHALTKKNFALAFGPIANAKEATTYLRVYHAVFVNQFAVLLIKGGEGSDDAPESSRIAPVKNGFEARLIFHNFHHRACLYAIELHLDFDGTVTQRSRKVIKELGGGIMF